MRLKVENKGFLCVNSPTTSSATHLLIGVLKEKYKAWSLTKKRRVYELMTEGCPQNTSEKYFV